MQNIDSLKFFENLSNGNVNIKTPKINDFNDYSLLDANFIMKFISKNSKILDLASGTGITINKYYKNVKKIVAVEQFLNFSNFIKKSPNIEVVNDNILNYVPKETFDFIMMFGIMQYFSENEAIELYQKYKKYLNKNGKLIIKQQFGLKEDVNVCGYSEELKKEYFSIYRHIDKEMNILKECGYKNLRKYDIYPSSANRWENTHFFAIVAQN